MNTWEMNRIWKAGKEAAINGFEVNDGPYKHDPRKRAWVLGFRAGLEIVRSKKRV